VKKFLQLVHKAIFSLVISFSVVLKGKLIETFIVRVFSIQKLVDDGCIPVRPMKGPFDVPVLLLALHPFAFFTHGHLTTFHRKQASELLKHFVW